MTEQATMTTSYTVSYGHSETDSPSRMTFECATDADVIRRIKDFVAEGYRNETWATVRLADDKKYQVNNRHGDALGYYVQSAAA